MGDLTGATNQRLRSHRARTATSSAIRDLLAQARRPGMISLAGGIPDPDRFPLDHLAPLVERIVREQGRSVLQYGLTSGEPGVREVLARKIDADLDPEAVIVTTGSQQGLDLITRVTVDPGDAVVVGDPDYLGALQVFRSYDADLVPIPVDGDGLQVDILAERLAEGLRPTLCYVVVHFHNPTGASLTSERRAQLHDLAEQYGFLVVEDDPYRELYYDGNEPEGPPPGADNLIQLRSVSKVLTPGLRIGWMTGPQWLLDDVVIQKQAVDLHTSTLTQAIAAEALEASWFREHVDGLRQSYGAKRDALVDALHDRLGDAISTNDPSGGMFAWVQMPEGVDTTDLLVKALDEGVAFVPGAAFAVERDLSRWLRLSWATPRIDQLPEAVDRLARAL